jgi:uncharacterized membrane protein
MATYYGFHNAMSYFVLILVVFYIFFISVIRYRRRKILRCQISEAAAVGLQHHRESLIKTHKNHPIGDIFNSLILQKNNRFLSPIVAEVKNSRENQPQSLTLKDRKLVWEDPEDVTKTPKISSIADSQSVWLTAKAGFILGRCVMMISPILNRSIYIEMANMGLILGFTSFLAFHRGGLQDTSESPDSRGVSDVLGDLFKDLTIFNAIAFFTAQLGNILAILAIQLVYFKRSFKHPEEDLATISLPRWKRNETKGKVLCIFVTIFGILTALTVCAFVPQVQAGRPCFCLIVEVCVRYLILPYIFGGLLTWGFILARKKDWFDGIISILPVEFSDNHKELLLEEEALFDVHLEKLHRVVKRRFFRFSKPIGDAVESKISTDYDNMEEDLSDFELDLFPQKIIKEEGTAQQM